MVGEGVHAGVGALLREWRARRAITQLELALDTGISTRHLSFVETERSKPGRDVLMRIGDRLEIPFRERNELLLAAGYAPAFPERPMSDPELAPVREAIDVILAAHEPNPALVVNRYWDVVAANAPMAALGEWVDPALLEPPLNAMRVGLHPRGLARWIVNLAEVRAYFLGRLERQVALTGDPKLAALLHDVARYPGHENDRSDASEAAPQILTPTMQMSTPDGRVLAFMATVATFGTAMEVTTSELSIELAFAADNATADALRELAGDR
jgi:transcriptional regulator with XRE-family HTH domain